MKKSRVVLAIGLAIIILVTIMNAPTFSWFSRPQNQYGDVMKLTSKNEYGVYNGKDVSIVSTMMSGDGGYTYDVTPQSLGGSDVDAYGRNYYCTSITNTSNHDMNVSLYASKLSIDSDPNNGTLALGVNSPTRNYRDYSALARQSYTTDRDTMRIYFQKDDGVAGWAGTDFYICWKEGGSAIDGDGTNGTYYHLTWCGDPGHNNTYYADIPKTATQAFFCVANWGTHDNGSPDYSLRSVLCNNLAGDGVTQTSSRVYKITGRWNNGNHEVDHYGCACANIKTYYSSVSLAGGETYSSSDPVNAILQSGWYAAGQLKFYSSDTSLFTVDENTGTITTNSNGLTGEAILYTKAVNSNGYWDTMEVQTTIKVTASGMYEFNNVPIVRNMLIPGTVGSDPDNPQNVKKVYWFVYNNSPRLLDYDIDSVYLSM